MSLPLWQVRARAEWPDQADQIIGLINGTIDPETLEDVQHWVKQCYHRPNPRELIMCALNQVIEGYGVEGLTREGAVYPCGDYVNMGDTYTTTIVYYGGRFRVTDWGTIVEGWGE